MFDDSCTFLLDSLRKVAFCDVGAQARDALVSAEQACGLFVSVATSPGLRVLAALC